MVSCPCFIGLESNDRLKLPPIKGASKDASLSDISKSSQSKYTGDSIENEKDDDERKAKNKKTSTKKKSRKSEKKRDLFELLSSKKNLNEQKNEEPGQPRIRFADVFQLTDKDFEQVNLEQLHKFQMNVSILRKILIVPL